MKRLTCCLALLLFFSTAFTQQLYFIYLQTEPEQPFFIKANNKVFSSTATGYVILTRLADSVHTITVGFPQNKWPEQQFKIDIKAKDHGYVLKNYGDKGWGLTDLQTSALQMATVAAGENAPVAETGNVSVFTDVLAKAANDPSLRDKPAPASQPQQAVVQPVNEPAVAAPDTREPVQAVTVETVKKEDTPATATVVYTEPVVAADYKPSVVTRKSESSTTEGFGLTFVDEYADGTSDTIRIMIPNQRSFASIIQPVPKDEKKFLDIPADKTAEASPQSQPVTAVRNYCADTATESDFRKLRKKMAAHNNDDDMVSEAAKSFRAKCFSVEQVKHLSSLFLFDSGKYKLFDAAYTHVGDVENFTRLQAELSDKYYINRFQAMLRN